MPSRPLPLLAVVLAAAFAAPLPAQDEAPPAPAPVIREVRPGHFELGKIQLDQTARTVRFPGVLNMKDGIVEYLLVTPHGATHESLLVSEITPNDLHFVMLLLGAKGAGLHAPGPQDKPPGQIDAQYLKNAPQLQGDRIAISVAWKAGDAEKTAPVEDWIYNTATKSAMVRGPWTYNGSMFNDGIFLAQLEGAFAAVVTYPSALINNPRRGRDNDQLWIVNEKAVPAVKTPLDIIIHLLPTEETPPKP